MGEKCEWKWVVWGSLEGRTRERERELSGEGGNCERRNKKRIEGNGW